MGITAAEKSFRQRVKDAMAPLGYVHYWPGEGLYLDDDPEGVLVSHWGTGVDLGGYERAFNLYGAYLELIGQDEPVEEHRVIIFPTPQEVLINDEESRTPRWGSIKTNCAV